MKNGWYCRARGDSHIVWIIFLVIALLTWIQVGVFVIKTCFVSRYQISFPRRQCRSLLFGKEGGGGCCLFRFFGWAGGREGGCDLFVIKDKLLFLWCNTSGPICYWQGFIFLLWIVFRRLLKMFLFCFVAVLSLFLSLVSAFKVYLICPYWHWLCNFNTLIWLCVCVCFCVCVCVCFSLSLSLSLSLASFRLFFFNVISEWYSKIKVCILLSCQYGVIIFVFQVFKTD